MGVNRFEDLRVWQAAKRQADMNGASLSVMFNISEGFLRRRDKETLQFLRYAFSSNGELKSGYYAASGRKYVTASESSELIELNESIARMLRRWQSKLEDR